MRAGPSPSTERRSVPRAERENSDKIALPMLGQLMGALVLAALAIAIILRLRFEGNAELRSLGGACRGYE
jgi:hypothetical protein